VLGELSCWLKEMQNIEAIRSSPRFSCMEDFHSYLTGMFYILQGDRRAARHSLGKLPWGKYKLRLGVALLLPTAVARHVKN
jgi:hypothetical protein